MLLGKNHKIESDSMNITLSKRRIAEKGIHKGEVWWETLGYYATIGSALRDFADRCLGEAELQELQQILKKQDEIYSLIESLHLDEAVYRIPEPVESPLRGITGVNHTQVLK